MISLCDHCQQLTPWHCCCPTSPAVTHVLAVVVAKRHRESLALARKSGWTRRARRLANQPVWRTAA